jgi:hypothetical protein
MDRLLLSATCELSPLQARFRLGTGCPNQKRENFRSLAWNIKILTFVYISTALRLLESIMVDKYRSEC